VTVGNLETVLADSGDSFKCSPNSTHCYAFRVPTAWAPVLKDAGFDGLSIANNHAGDFGPAGRKTTMAALDGQGIKHSGPIGDLGTMTVKGKKVALVGMAFGSDMYRIQDIAIDQRLIALLKKSNDLVVVIFHAGAEGSGADHTKPGTEKFLGEDRGDSIRFAHAMIDAGADLMIGAGPHLLRAMERYKGRLIAYSLGNFSSWETFGLGGSGGISGVLTVDLAPNGVATAVKLTPTLLEKPGKPMPDPKAQGVARVRQLSKEDFGDAFLDEQGSWSLK
jgi:poly-gamma-glutamate capsule biosynthesis protein CapA/YwtB (metallophosphatase superfamily)